MRNIPRPWRPGGVEAQEAWKDSEPRALYVLSQLAQGFGLALPYLARRSVCSHNQRAGSVSSRRSVRTRVRGGLGSWVLGLEVVLPHRCEKERQLVQQEPPASAGGEKQYRRAACPLAPPRSLIFPWPPASGYRRMHSGDGLFPCEEPARVCPTGPSNASWAKRTWS